MGRRPIDFAFLRGAIAPRQVLELRGWSPVWTRGVLARGPCPIHGSRSHLSRSLCVSDRVYYCHVCHATGDAVGLYGRLYQVGPWEAAYELCGRLGITIPYLRGGERR